MSIIGNLELVASNSVVMRESCYHSPDALNETTEIPVIKFYEPFQSHSTK
jgi:hypothetical protein